MPNNGINNGGLTGGSTYYLRIKNQQGQYLNTTGPAFENYNASNIANYVVAAATANSAGGWFGVFPSNAATVAGVYDIEFVQQAGGSGATSDPVLGNQTQYWDGANLYNVTALNASGAALATASALTTVQTSITNIASGATVVNANNASGSAIPTLAQIWQDATAGHFTTANSIGKSLFTGKAPGDTLGGLVCNNAIAEFSAMIVNGSTSLNTLAISGTTTFTGAVAATNSGNSIGGVSVVAGGIESPQSFNNTGQTTISPGQPTLSGQ